MELYIVIIEDRHLDTTAHPFTDKDKAISEAKRIAKENCGSPEEYEEHDFGKDAGWIFYAQYSYESDCVRVVKTELDKEIQHEDS
jgi:hypothetical protein